MANFGGLNNTNKFGSEFLLNNLYDGAIGAGLNFPETGTIDTVHFFCQRSDTNTCRLALFTGGAGDDDPDGATKIWDSGEIANANIPAALGWMDVSTGGVSINSGVRLWLSIKAAHNGVIVTVVDSPDNGDLRLHMLYGTGMGSDPTTAFPSTVPSTGPSNQQATAWKWRVTYSAGGTPATANPTGVAGTGQAGSTAVEARPGPPYTMMTVTG